MALPRLRFAPVKSDQLQSLSRALIFLGVILVSMVVASVVGELATKLLFGQSTMLMPGTTPQGEGMWWQLHFSNFFSQALGFGGAVFIARAMWNRSVPVGLKMTPRSLGPVALLLILLMVLVTGPIMAASYELNVAAIPEGSVLEQIFKPLEDMLESLTSFLVEADGAKRVVVILSVALLPAVFEELAFRGALQPLLIRATGNPWVGIVLASIIFSAIHFQFYGFLPRVLLGMLFGWLAYRTGSILPGMVAHFLNNAGAAITLWITGSMTEDVFPLETWTVLLSLVLTAGTVIAYDRLLKPDIRGFRAN